MQPQWYANNSAEGILCIFMGYQCVFRKSSFCRWANSMEIEWNFYLCNKLPDINYFVLFVTLELYGAPR